MNPSKYWIELNKQNRKQLEDFGYENFKRTVALNYFTWTIAGPSANLNYLLHIFKDPQVKFLLDHLPLKTIILDIFRSFKKHDLFTWTQSIAYNFFTNLLWDYVKRNDRECLLHYLDEPLEGNPPRLYRGKKLISQDLAHSVLEYYSATNDINNPRTIIELGAGYGRTAYVFLKARPYIKYIIVDIVPALYIAERYLENQFPDKKIFKFRQFNTFKEVEKEFNEADIIFLYSYQLEKLPSKYADLFITISSLHEMRPEQIKYYFKQIDRLAKYFYTKQWKVSKIPYENITIKQEDYPVPKNWKEIYSRECAVQVRFFEALYSVK